MESFLLVLPVFLLMGVGAVLGRQAFMGPQVIGGINQLVYRVGLPALVFANVATTPLDDFSPRLTLGCLLAVLLIGVVSYRSASFFGAQTTRRSLSLAAFRGNLAYIIFPVLESVYGPPGLRLGSLVIGFLTPWMLFLAVVILLPSDQRGLKILRMAITNPILVAALAGLTYSHLGLPWPRIFANVLGPLGQMALPLALLVIGANLRFSQIRAERRPLWTAVGLKLIGLPLLGWGILRLLGVAGLELQVGVLVLAAPAAVSSAVLSEEMDPGPGSELMRSSIALGTLLAVLTIPIWITLLN